MEETPPSHLYPFQTFSLPLTFLTHTRTHTHAHVRARLLVRTRGSCMPANTPPYSNTSSTSSTTSQAGTSQDSKRGKHKTTWSSRMRFLRSRRAASSPAAPCPSSNGASIWPQIWQWNSPSLGSMRSTACSVLYVTPHPGHTYSCSGFLHPPTMPDSLNLLNP